MAREQDFLYVSGRIRVLETKLLGQNTINRILDADGPDEALKIIGDTEYGSGISEMEDIYDFEKLLDKSMENTYEIIRDSIQDHRFIRFFTLKYDYHNLKVVIKDEILGTSSRKYYSSLGQIKPELLEKLSSDEKQELPQSIEEAYTKAKEIYEETKDPQKVDIVLDKALFSDMGKLAEEIRDPFLLKYFKTMIDLINIKILVRLKRIKSDGMTLQEAIFPGGNLSQELLLELFPRDIEDIVEALSKTDYHKVVETGLSTWGKTGSLATFEKMSDDYLLGLAREGLYKPFGSEPLIGYLAARETEVKILRTLLVGKINDIPKDMIRERLRELYV